MPLKAAWRRWSELKRRRRWVGWLQDGVLLLLVFGAVLAWQTRNLVPSGEVAPSFVLRDLSGREWNLASLRGKPVVLHFWAPWCGVCKTETGAISSFSRSQQGDAHVLSVALAYEEVADVQRFVSEQGVDYPVLLGTDEVMRAFRVDTFPTTYFISEDGRIEDAAVGYTTGLGLRWRLWF